MVNDAAQVLHAGVSLFSPSPFLKEASHCTSILYTPLISLHTCVLHSCVLVVAEDGQAFWHDNNRVSLNGISLAHMAGHRVEEVGIVFVDNSWSTISDDLDLGEDLRVKNIDVGNDSQATSQTDTRNVEGLQLGL